MAENDKPETAKQNNSLDDNSSTPSTSPSINPDLSTAPLSPAPAATPDTPATSTTAEPASGSSLGASGTAPDLSKFNAGINYIPVEARKSEAATAQTKRKTLAIIIRDRAVLYAAYMPFLKSGGLFIPTKKPFTMGEECVLSIALLDDPAKYVTRAKVVWITPAGSQGNKAGGVGVEFAEDSHGNKLRTRIEEILGNLLQSSNATHTM